MGEKIFYKKQVKIFGIHRKRPYFCVATLAQTHEQRTSKILWVNFFFNLLNIFYEHVSFPSAMYVCRYGLIALFSHSCAKDASVPAEQATNEIDFRDLNPNPATDCKCYMRILSVSNPGVYGTDLWALIDVTYSRFNPNGFQLEGSGAFWKHPVTNIEYVLPSDFFELDSPSNGFHELWLAFFNFSGAEQRPTIKTEVKCYLQNNDGPETLMTTTEHEFKWEEGNITDLGEVRSFYKEFSCYDLTVPIVRN